MRKENELKMRLKSLMNKKQIVDNRKGKRYGSVTAFALKDAFTQFQEDLIKLQKFVEMNSTGFRKILKKWDKRSKSQTKELYISRQVEVQPCFNSELLSDLDDNAALCIKELDELCAKIGYSSIISEDDHVSSNLDLSESENTIINFMSMEKTDTVKAMLENIKSDNGIFERILWRICGDPNIQPKYAELLHSFQDIDYLYSDDITDRSCLHEAARSGHLNMVQHILKKTSKNIINGQDIYGKRPLHYAASGHHADIVRYLLKEGAEKEPIDHDGFTPMLLAISSFEIVKIFLDEKVTLKNSASSSTSILSLACMYGDFKVIELLLENGADLSHSDSEGLFPIHIACRKGHLEAVNRICKFSKAEIERRDKYNGWIPIFFAASEGHLNVVKSLISLGCVLDSLDEQGWNAAAYALWQGHVEVSELLRTKSPETFPLRMKNQPVIETESAEADNLDDLPSLELPPPIIPVYGHGYLDKRFLVEIKLGTSGDEPCDPVKLWGSRGSSSSKLLVAMKNEHTGATSGMPYNLVFPSQEKEEILKFEGAWEGTFNHSIYFYIYPTFGSKLVGKSVVLSSQLKSIFNSSYTGANYHSLTLPVFGNDLKIIGEIRAEIFLVKPFTLSKINMNEIGTYWKSKTVISNKQGSHAISNLGGMDTAYGNSMITATSLEPEYLVLELQVSKDGEFFVYKHEAVDVGNLKLPLSQLSSGYIKRIAGYSTIGTCNLSAKSIRDFLDNHLVSLDNLLDIAHPSISFCLQLDFIASNVYGGESTYENLNFTIDLVLKSIYNKIINTNSRRSILFTSFNKLICTLLNLKQPNFPVLFSASCGFSNYEQRSKVDGKSTHENQIARESDSMQEAVKFAKRSNLLGVICHCNVAIRAPILIEAAKRAGLFVATYGRLNAQSSYVEVQKNMGVDGIISSHIFKLDETSIAK